MTPPASPHLPEAVEQAIIEHGLAAEAYFEAFLHLPTKVNRRFAEKVESADALRATILAYGAARERQGIERAVGEVDRWVSTYFGEPTEDSEQLVVNLRALPVDGATP